MFYSNMEKEDLQNAREIFWSDLPENPSEKNIRDRVLESFPGLQRIEIEKKNNWFRVWIEFDSTGTIRGHGFGVPFSR